MTALARYDAACRMLAEAVSFDDVRNVRDEMEFVKLHGRQVKDRDLIAKATELQTRAERRLGELLLEAESLGWIGRGRPKKNSENVPTPERFTLEEAGIDRKLSASSQKLASIPQADFERGVVNIREKIISGQATIINGARAIMSSREEPDGGLDLFPTAPWGTRALIERVFRHMGREGHCKFQTAWEPACGYGHMAEVLREYFKSVSASDIEEYGYGDRKVDFLSDDTGEIRTKFDWIITNPPFGELTERFVLQALDLAGTGVAMFVRLQWLETVGRYEAIFCQRPPTLISFFAERIPLHKDRWEPKGSTATAYIWLVWVKGAEPAAPFWIPPGCRDALTRTDDVKRFTVKPVKKLVREPADEAAA